VDHELRKREITDAVVRLTVKGGLASATFREVAAEAGVSVRLVQYYFGTKDQLLLETQRHVAERSVTRIRRLLAESPRTPREVLRTVMRSFIPVDNDSRDAMLMFVALFTASLLDPALKRNEAAEVPTSMRHAFQEQLERAKLRAGVDAGQEALVLLVVVTGLSQGVLDGQITAADALTTIDYALDRAIRIDRKILKRVDKRTHVR
jgi:TetR/AcrR family transcriptional repressor of bet genes